ncbi:MAG: S-layer homology domain-containing protein [Oscillospiraceae bacterium]|nr:S-layer homology domain-containing protein [Oscillospiraceae bacterium]
MDVPADAWYRNDVAAIYQTGGFNGTTSTTFAPDSLLTNGQAIAIAARLHQYGHEGWITLQNGTGQWYSTYVDYAIPDVKGGDVFSEKIYSFYRAGILTGDAKGYFKPGSYIKRGEMAAILARMPDPSKQKTVTMAEATEFGVDLPAFGQAPAIAVPEDWFRSEALSGMNNCLPYAESCFYILRYMLYAKEHHPDSYQGILENDEFRLAFSTIDSLYSNLIQSCGCTYDQYLTEMQKPEYVQMAALLQS